MARLDRAIQKSPEHKSLFAAQTRGGWMAATSAAMTLWIQAKFRTLSRVNKVLRDDLAQALDDRFFLGFKRTLMQTRPL